MKTYEQLIASTSQLSREEAIAYAENSWKKLSKKQRFEFQVSQRLLAMPLSEFHKAAEVALKRPVWTHEFANMPALWKEYINGGTY